MRFRRRRAVANARAARVKSVNGQRSACRARLQHCRPFDPSEGSDPSTDHLPRLPDRTCKNSGFCQGVIVTDCVTGVGDRASERPGVSPPCARSSCLAPSGRHAGALTHYCGVRDPFFGSGNPTERLSGITTLCSSLLTGPHTLFSLRQLLKVPLPLTPTHALARRSRPSKHCTWRQQLHPPLTRLEFVINWLVRPRQHLCASAMASEEQGLLCRGLVQ